MAGLRSGLRVSSRCEVSPNLLMDYVATCDAHWDSWRSKVRRGKFGKGCLIYKARQPGSGLWVLSKDVWYVRFQGTGKRDADQSLCFYSEREALLFMLSLVKYGMGDHPSMFRFERHERKINNVQL